MPSPKLNEKATANGNEANENAGTETGEKGNDEMGSVRPAMEIAPVENAKEPAPLAMEIGLLVRATGRLAMGTVPAENVKATVGLPVRRVSAMASVPEGRFRLVCPDSAGTENLREKGIVPAERDFVAKECPPDRKEKCCN